MVLSHLGVSFLEEQHRLLTEKGPGHLWFCAPNRPHAYLWIDCRDHEDRFTGEDFESLGLLFGTPLSQFRPRSPVSRVGKKEEVRGFSDRGEHR